jgi:hypothetical protein
VAESRILSRHVGPTPSHHSGLLARAAGFGAVLATRLVMTTATEQPTLTKRPRRGAKARASRRDHDASPAGLLAFLLMPLTLIAVALIVAWLALRLA